jgi:CheY-like chemotaxis protein
MTTPAIQPTNPLVLVVDDDPSTRYLLRHFLEREGYAIEEAEDGNQALEIYEQCRPNIVLLDALMPGRNGFEVCEWLQSQHAAERTPSRIGG